MARRRLRDTLFCLCGVNAALIEATIQAEAVIVDSLQRRGYAGRRVELTGRLPDDHPLVAELGRRDARDMVKLAGLEFVDVPGRGEPDGDR